MKLIVSAVYSTGTSPRIGPERGCEVECCETAGIRVPIGEPGHELDES